MKSRYLETELLVLGMLTAAFLGLLTKELATGISIALFYLLVMYIPFLSWTESLNESVFIKFVAINILGLFFNPLAYYFLNLLGASIGLPTVVTVALGIFASGTAYQKRIV
jgi:hypothetical protein